MTNRNYTTPAPSGPYQIKLTRTQRAPQRWAYQITDAFTGAVMAGSEVEGSRVLVLVEAQRKVLRLTLASQPFYIPPVQSAYRIPC